MSQDDYQIHFFLPVQPVQVCILPVQRTGGLVSGLAYADDHIPMWRQIHYVDCFSVPRRCVAPSSGTATTTRNTIRPRRRPNGRWSAYTSVSSSLVRPTSARSVSGGWRLTRPSISRTSHSTKRTRNVCLCDRSAATRACVRQSTLLLLVSSCLKSPCYCPPTSYCDLWVKQVFFTRLPASMQVLTVSVYVMFVIQQWALHAAINAAVAPYP